MASRRHPPDEDTQVDNTVRLMEDIAVEQQLRHNGRGHNDHKVELPQSMGGVRVLISMVVQEAKAACLLQNTNTGTPFMPSDTHTHARARAHTHTHTPRAPSSKMERTNGETQIATRSWGKWKN